jgi:S-(hydroxymethyl)glutathione dehydrogenase/alcohol dehydrogenase
MKAAVLVELNKPLVMGDLDLPGQLSFGQVLVKIHYSGICGAQINEIEGTKGPDRFLPHLLGHEGSATVLDIGPGVKTVAKGDRVVLHWRPSDGLQSDPPAYQWNGQRVNAGWVTTFNDHAVVSENRVTKIPSDFDLRIAPLFGCAVTTAMGVVNRDAEVQVGQSVVVFGVGGVVVNIVQSAHMVSACPIVAVDVVDSKLEWARTFGATHAFNGRDENLAAKIREVVGAGGADVVVDTTGRARVIEQAYDLVRTQQNHPGRCRKVTFRSTRCRC